MNRRQLWGLSQASLGALALVAPDALAAACAGSEPRAPQWIVRILGGRLVVQGGFLLIRPTDEAIILGCSIDALHGASMLAATMVKPQYRRSALIAGILAATSVAVGVRVRG